MEREPSGTNETTDTIERLAFDQFTERLQLAAKEYINDNTSCDAVRRSERACRVLSALLQEIDSYMKQQVVLN
jgi:hypothetical protein